MGSRCDAKMVFGGCGHPRLAAMESQQMRVLTKWSCSEAPLGVVGWCSIGRDHLHWHGFYVLLQCQLPELWWQRHDGIIPARWRSSSADCPAGGATNTQGTPKASPLMLSGRSPELGTLFLLPLVLPVGFHAHSRKLLHPLLSCLQFLGRPFGPLHFLRQRQFYSLQ